MQLRDKKCSDKEMVEMGRALLSVLPSTIPLIINDRVAVAKAVGVGVHVGQQDISPVEARRQLGKTAIIGLTIHDRVDLAKQYQSVIDYVGVGPVFPTQTKENPAPLLGVNRLSKIVAAAPVPVVAIGGINSGNAPEVRAQGVAGIAVCSAIMDAPDPYTVSTTLCSD